MASTSQTRSSAAPKVLTVAVMGAGAVGCYYGGMLARAGHEVVLIARPAHVQAIAQDGLRMETTTFDEPVRLKASPDASAVQGAQLVLFCVKSLDTESAGALMRPHLAPDALGVVPAKRCRQRRSPAHRVAAAHGGVGGGVRRHGDGRPGARQAPWPGRTGHRATGASEAVAKALIAAGVPTEISGNVRGALWAKLIINCAYNAVSAIAQLPYGKTVVGEGIKDVMRDVVAECQAVARAEGVQVAGDVDAAIRKIIETMPNQSSSTAQDLARGKRSEIDYLNGLIVRRGEALGIATPANRVLWALVKLLESKHA